MENVYVRYSSSYTSSLERLPRELLYGSINNQPKRSLKQCFHAAEKLITDQEELTGIPVIGWQQLTWQRTTLLTDKAVQFATAKTYVFSDSVLCVG